MEELITALGKKANCDYFNAVSPVRQVNIRVLNISMLKAAELFSNPAETVRITCGSKTANGYTKLVAIVQEGNAVRVVLEKE